MTWLAIRLFIGKALERLMGVFGLIRRYPLQAAIIIAVLALFWQNRAIHSARVELAAMKAAQVTATAHQQAVNHAPAAKSQAIAEKSNDDAVEYYAKGRAAGLAYAASHRLPASCRPVDSGLPRTDNPAPHDDGQGDVAEMVALSRADYDILTGNSLRLAKVQQDAQSLIDAGVAIPEPAFGN